MNNLEKELYLSYEFFIDTYSKNDISYGMIPDTYPGDKAVISSIAGSGYLFSALVIGVEFGYIEKEEAYKIALKSLNTYLNLETDHGWFYHFYNINNGLKDGWIEISTIDTAILLLGILTAGNYFKGEVENKAFQIFNRVDFNYFLKKYKTMLAMAVKGNNEMFGHWDRYAEQLMLYVLGCASDNKEYRLDKSIYYNLILDRGSYNNHNFIYSWHGALFTYQFSHAYIDFRNLVDENDIDWFNNSVEASLAAYEYAKDNEGLYKSLHRLSWGLTACDAKNGYSGRYGSPPTGPDGAYTDGTVAPCAAIGSIVFTPKESIDALNHFYSIDGLVGEYGLKDSYNEDQKFISNYYISIDKGITMVMIANYLKETIWKNFNSIKQIQESLLRLGFKRRK